MDPLKKVDKDFVCVPQGLNTFSITTFALEEEDHATLREDLSFHNTFPSLAQQSWQHWRSENQNIRFKRIQNTGKSSQGAGAAPWPSMCCSEGLSLGHRRCCSFRESHWNFTCANVQVWETVRFTKTATVSGPRGWASPEKQTESPLSETFMFFLPCFTEEITEETLLAWMSVSRHSLGQKQNQQKINK